MPFKNEPELYSVWKAMRARCNNPNHSAYPNYGGRGIKICERWQDYKLFEIDMLPRPKDHTIDRIDNNMGYSPENCRWATRKEQQRNQRCTRTVTIDGVEYKAVELAEKCGVKADIIVDRVNRGCSMAEVLSVKKLNNVAGLSLGGIANGARQKAKTRCPKGHEYTPENTYICGTGARVCRACHRAKAKRQREAKKARHSSISLQ